MADVHPKPHPHAQHSANPGGAERMGQVTSGRNFAPLRGEEDFSNAGDGSMWDELRTPPPGFERRKTRKVRFLSAAFVILLIVACVLITLKFVVFRSRERGLKSQNGRLVVGKDIPFDIKGVSWYGMELEGMCLEGLKANSMDNILDTVKSLGFNAIRLPLALDLFVRNHKIPDHEFSFALNPEIQDLTYMQLVKLFVSEAEKRDILVLLDLHRLESTKWPTGGLWYSDTVSVSTVFKFWRELAELCKDDWNVMGADVFNEPHGATTWSSWRSFVEQVGNYIHEVEPSWLIVAEGVGNLKGDPRPEPVFWGENLNPAAEDPPVLTIRDKIALSPHVYGPAVSGQPYFNTTAFPDNMPGIWDDHFGNASSSGLALLVGEYGGTAIDDDLVWQERIISYMSRNQIGSFYWCLNPGSEDTGGIFLPDWSTLDTTKTKLLANLKGTDVGEVRRHF